MGAVVTLLPFILYWNAFIICIVSCFCSGVNATQLSNNSLSSGESSTIVSSAKNCDRVMPKPLHMASSVAIEGSTFLRKMFASVDSDKPHSFDRRYLDQPRSSISFCKRSCVFTVWITSFLY